MIATTLLPPFQLTRIRSGHVDDYLEIGQKAGASDVHLGVSRASRSGGCMELWSRSGRTRRR